MERQTSRDSLFWNRGLRGDEREKNGTKEAVRDKPGPNQRKESWKGEGMLAEVD